MPPYNSFLNDDSDGVMTPLVSHRSPKQNENQECHCGIIFNRVLVLMGLACLAGASVYFEWEMRLMTGQLATDEAKIEALQAKVISQSEIIDRFNVSVTNQDVMERLDALEGDLKATEGRLEDDLHHVKTDISNQLNKTLDDLNDSVTKAEHQINQEVEKVKGDMNEYARVTQDQFSMENSFMVYQLAGTFTLLSCLIAMWHITAHIRKLNQPVVQRKILAILWMSPVYAITSWFSLVFHEAEGYLAIVKDGYEAYIIYQFLSFCISVLGRGDREVVVDLLARRADHLTPPFRLFGCCFPDVYESDRALADAILLQCQFFAMQFVFLRPLTTTAKTILDHYEYYGGGDGPMDYRAPQFYLVMIQNLSVFTAFAGLLKFYHAVDKDLAWCRPLPKFLCIKGVVFMTFWQGLAIAILAETTSVGGKDADEWAQSSQNFLICLEMLLFSIAHFYCFPTEEWEEGYRAKASRGNFGDSLAWGDFMQDLKLIIRSKKKKKKKQQSEPTVPEEEEDDTQEEESTVVSEITNGFEGSVDEECGLTDELKASLRNAAKSDDPVVKDARDRILKSDVLNDPEWDAADGRDFADDETAKRGVERGVKYAKAATKDQADDGATPTETTGLLSSSERGTKKSGGAVESEDKKKIDVEQGDVATAKSPPSSPTKNKRLTFSDEVPCDKDQKGVKHGENVINEASRDVLESAKKEDEKKIDGEQGENAAKNQETGESKNKKEAEGGALSGNETPSDAIGQVTPYEEILRPSVFTTVAEIGKQQGGLH